MLPKSEVHARLAQKFGKFSFRRKLDIDIVVCLRPSQISVIVLSLRMITRLLLNVSAVVTYPFSRTPLITVLSTEGLSWVNIPFILLFIIHPNPGLFYSCSFIPQHLLGCYEFITAKHFTPILEPPCSQN